VGLQKLEETAYWIELSVESDILASSRLTDLQAEIEELTAILVTCVMNARPKRADKRKDEGGRMKAE
jgi:hypothetical protein